MKKYFIFLFWLAFFPALAFASEKVDINTALLEQLDQITNVGPITAQKIINARPYSSLDDLLKVNGIGQKTLDKIKEQGIACVNCGASNEESRPPEPAAAAAGETAVSSSGEVGPPISYPAGVFINEVLANAEGPDEENEFIELYNSNNFEIDLSGWKISDSAGSITNYIFPNDKKMGPFGFLALKRPETKITLNNDQDQLTLYSPDKAVKDTMSYNSAPNGQSYNKTAPGWQWSLNLTPGSANSIARQALSESEGLLKDKKNDNNIIEDSLAGLGYPLNQEGIKTQNPWFLFFMALAITIFSAVVVLFIKLKFKKNHVRT